MKKKDFSRRVLLLAILICCVQIISSEELIYDTDACDAEDAAITDLFQQIEQCMSANVNISHSIDKQTKEINDMQATVTRAIKEKWGENHETVEKDQASLLRKLEESVKSNVIDNSEKLNRKFEAIETKYDEIQRKLDMQLERNHEALLQSIEQIRAQKPAEQYEKLLSKIEEQQREIGLIKQTCSDRELEYEKEIKKQLQQIEEKHQEIEKMKNVEKKYKEDNENQRMHIKDMELKLLGLQENIDKKNENHLKEIEMLKDQSKASGKAYTEKIEEYQKEKDILLQKIAELGEQNEKLLSKTEEQQREIDLIKQISSDRELEYKEEIKKQLQKIEEKHQEIENLKGTCEEVRKEHKEDNENQHQQIIEEKHKLKDMKLKLEGLQKNFDEHNENHLKEIEKLKAQSNANERRYTEKIGECEKEKEMSLNKVELEQQTIVGLELECKDKIQKLYEMSHIVIQRRMDGSVNFARTWHEYQMGFGNSSGEFFIGLATIHTLTNQRPYTLRIDLEDWEENRKYAEYDNFVVGNESEKYALKSLGTYSGNAGDSFSDSLNHKFSTMDQDNDKFPNSCSLQYGGGGGWWFHACSFSHLNGVYKKGKIDELGVLWSNFKGTYYYSLKSAKMTLRPN